MQCATILPQNLKYLFFELLTERYHIETWIFNLIFRVLLGLSKKVVPVGETQYVGEIFKLINCDTGT
jgi:hypothetical protein